MEKPNGKTDGSGTRFSIDPPSPASPDLSGIKYIPGDGMVYLYPVSTYAHLTQGGNTSPCTPKMRRWQDSLLPGEAGDDKKKKDAFWKRLIRQRGKLRNENPRAVPFAYKPGLELK